MARILIIEDEAPVRENITELLQAEGYSTIEARDGVDGLRAARQELPDLILCDIRMPRLDGMGVLAQMIHDPITASIPFIFLTARTEPQDLRSGMGLGADDYITKPFSRYDLLASVRRRLEKRALLASQMELKLNELSARIEQRLPSEMLAPLSVLLSHSEMLVKANWLGNDPVQVRGTAREINRAALRLAHLVQSYLLFSELESHVRGSQLLQKLDPGELVDVTARLESFSKDMALEFNREEDFLASIQPVRSAIPEKYLLVIVEELLDRAFRESIPGSVVEFDARFIDNQSYQLSVKDKGGRNLPQAVSAKSLYFDLEESPVGFLLIRRIAEIFQGRFHFVTDSDGGSRVECDLPGFKPLTD